MPLFDEESNLLYHYPAFRIQLSLPEGGTNILICGDNGQTSGDVVRQILAGLSEDNRVVWANCKQVNLEEAEYPFPEEP